MGCLLYVRLWAMSFSLGFFTVSVWRLESFFIVWLFRRKTGLLVLHLELFSHNTNTVRNVSWCCVYICVGTCIIRFIGWVIGFKIKKKKNPYQYIELCNRPFCFNFISGAVLCSYPCFSIFSFICFRLKTLFYVLLRASLSPF